MVNITNILLAANLLVLIVTISTYHWRIVKETQRDELIDIILPDLEEKEPKQIVSPPVEPCTNQEVPKVQQRDFYSIAKSTGTDKVMGVQKLPSCLSGSGEDCIYPDAKNKFCRTWGHFYHTMYQKALGPYSHDDTEPFQFLEIGFYQGNGFEAFMNFLPRAEMHSIELACVEDKQKWRWENAASKSKLYGPLLEQNRLHCGDQSDVNFLNDVWTKYMKRPDSPPLKVVVDDGSHIETHMAQTIFFWFPKIEPRGLLIVEDVQPLGQTNKFRTQFLPQIMADLHFCGDPGLPDEQCFPTLQPLLASIHCEMHICVFERNDEPTVDLSLEELKLPPTALDAFKCKALQL